MIKYQVSKKKRSKSGCFTCRRRKIKCDERKPQCGKCCKSQLSCVWPDNGVNSLPHNVDFILEKNVGSRNYEFVTNGIEDIKDRIHIKKQYIRKNASPKSEKDSKGLKFEAPFDVLESIEQTTKVTVFKLVHPENERNLINCEDEVTYTMQGLLETFEDNVLNGGGKASKATGLHNFNVSKSEINYFNSSETNKYLADEIGDFPYPSSSMKALTSTKFNTLGMYVPGIRFSETNSFWFDAFINGFIEAISPQVTVRNLAPGAIFVPHGIDNPIMMDIFYVCGLTFLSWNNPDLKLLSRKMYCVCLNNLANVLNSPDIEGTEDWVLSAMLLLCLREKFFGSISSKPGTHILQAFRIIQKKQMQKNGYSLKSQDQITMYGQTNNEAEKVYELVDDSNIISLDEEYNNCNAAAIKPPSLTRYAMHPSSITNSDKLLMESFLYNYSVNLLICDRNLMDFLPSPFEVFDQYREILHAQVFKSSIPWVNNPVFGAAFDVFEIAAKASWLIFKLPLDNAQAEIAFNLYNEASRYSVPPIPKVISERYTKIEKLRLEESRIMASSLSKAVLILLTKILNPKLGHDDDVVQNLVKSACDELMKISDSSSIWSICSLTLVIVGLAAISKDHQSYIRSRCNAISGLMHAGYMHQIGELLEEAWGKGGNPGPGWEILLNRNLLESICL